MEWLNSLFFEHSALQAVVIMAIIIAAGLGLGKIRFWGISLGVTCVFFAGILAGHLGFSINPDMLNYAESFGLVLFVYELGLQVGPGFFSSFRQGGIQLNMLGFGVILLGTLMAILISKFGTIPMSDMVGILCGATTNTPALGAAQQTLKQLGEPTTGAALSCAITYPLGVVGVILAMIAVRKLFVRKQDIETAESEGNDQTYIATFKVRNPAIFDKNVKQIAEWSQRKFVISRLWREDKVSIPTSETILQENDRLLITTTDKDAAHLTILFGKQEPEDWNKQGIDWDALDNKLVSKDIVITRPSLNGKKLGSLRLRNTYAINISRVTRSGIRLLATPGLVLQLGDRLTIVGETNALQEVEKVLGNATNTLRDPNLAAIFIGIVLGLVLGSIPIAIPGISTPVKLGLAGGPIVIGILIGSFGPRFRLVTYTTRSANLMLRGIGLSLYLACLGLDAGAHFFETVMRPEGALWIGIGFAITFIPVVLMALFALRVSRLDFGSTCGMLCGSMANPMALNYANETLPGDNPAVSYATVYPLSMFSRVIIAQIILMFFL
ncbi:MAG: putative transporter [Bacteroidaceae bacterium]|nr:putative transporter [Bacteroidaceae bacterium]